MIDLQYIRDVLTHSAHWSQGHGAQPDQPYLGGGMLYYALVHMLRAEVCVCLGSGGGFVPRVMRQAQRDIGILGVTILVDANRPESGYGKPDWLPETSFFRSQFPDIDFMFLTTEQAATMFKKQSLRIDFLHIDADHRRAYEDFILFKDMVAQHGVVTIHDTVEVALVREALGKIRRLEGWEVVNFPLWAGIALVKRKE